MKKKLIILLTAFMILSSTACENQTEVSDSNDTWESEENGVDTTSKETSSSADTDTDKAENDTTEQNNEFNIDINQCIEDLKSGLPLEPDYTFVNDYFISADKKNLTISIIVDDATAPEVALDFADTIVRQLNLYASMQDSSIAPSSKDFYGGLYEEYTALVGVAPASKVNNQNE